MSSSSPGFFFGRTRLIKLSPKKTWEGFIGGGISTVVFSVFVSIYVLFRWFLGGYGYFVLFVELNQQISLTNCKFLHQLLITHQMGAFILKTVVVIIISLQILLLTQLQT